MATILWIVLGGLVASIAKLVAWEKSPVGWAPVLLAGIAGAVAGGFVRNALFSPSAVPGFDIAAMLFAIAGAALGLLLLSVAYVRRRQSERITPRSEMPRAA